MRVPEGEKWASRVLALVFDSPSGTPARPHPLCARVRPLTLSPLCRYFCACKMSGNKPFCDGKHRGLPEDAVGKAFAKDYVPPAPA